MGIGLEKCSAVKSNMLFADTNSSDVYGKYRKLLKSLGYIFLLVLCEGDIV